MWNNWLKGNWKRCLIILSCLGLVVLRIVFPRIQVDGLTLWLIAIAVVFIIIPHPRILFPYIKRIKLWEAEIELKEDVMELGKQVEKVQNSVVDEPRADKEDLSPITNDVIKLATKSPRLALVVLSEAIEGQLTKRLQEAGIIIDRHYLLPQLTTLAEKSGIFQKEIGNILREFWNVRNRAAHGIGSDSESIMLALIFSGLDILNLLSVRRGETDKSGSG